MIYQKPKSNKQFQVPYFGSVTELGREFLDHHHADWRILKLFNTKFMEDSSYSASEAELLMDIE